MYETIGIIVAVIAVIIVGLRATGLIKIDISIGSGSGD
jgi:hypothetical protein